MTPRGVTQTQRTRRLRCCMGSLFFSASRALNISVFGTWRAGLFVGMCGQQTLPEPCWGILRKHGRLPRGGAEECGVMGAVPPAMGPPASVSDPLTDDLCCLFFFFCCCCRFFFRPISRRPPYARSSAQMQPLSPTSTHWPAAHTTSSHPTMSPPLRPHHPSVPPPPPSHIHR